MADEKTMNHTSILLLATVCALLTATGQIALKAGVSSPALASLLSTAGTGEFILRAAITPLVILGLLLYGASTVLWLVVLARADVSYAFPLVSLGFIFTTLYAHFALHEVLTTGRLTGIALIVLGVICVVRS